MKLTRFEAFLKEAMGLDSASIGRPAIQRAVDERIAATHTADADQYWTKLHDGDSERQALIEAIVVPETWFFRDAGAFEALARYAVRRAPPVGSPPLRLLSIPCSTGEEPYSMAMALLDAGLDSARFAIDAVDISARAIEQGRLGEYRKNSFRGADRGFRERHFEGGLLCSRVRECVRFHRSSLFHFPDVSNAAPYDAIFCRNLLIYFDRATQDRAVVTLTRLLAPESLLFVGPSETGLLLSHGLESANVPMAFAFRGPGLRRDPVPVTPTKAAPVPRSNPRQALKAAAPVRTESRSLHVFSPSPAPATFATHVAADLMRQAQALADSGNLSAAREQCEAEIRAHGPSAQAHYLLGLLHDAEANPNQAIQEYRRALYLDPHHQEALLHLAMLIEQAGDAAAAGRLYERAKRAAAREAAR